jgi:hypothetical protein
LESVYPTTKNNKNNSNEEVDYAKSEWNNNNHTDIDYQHHDDDHHHLDDPLFLLQFGSAMGQREYQFASFPPQLQEKEEENNNSNNQQQASTLMNMGLSSYSTTVITNNCEHKDKQEQDGGCTERVLLDSMDVGLVKGGIVADDDFDDDNDDDFGDFQQASATINSAYPERSTVIATNMDMVGSQPILPTLTLSEFDHSNDNNNNNNPPINLPPSDLQHQVDDVKRLSSTAATTPPSSTPTNI